MGFISRIQELHRLVGLIPGNMRQRIMQNVSYVPGEIAFPSLATGTEFLKCQAEYLGITD
jgi:ABC-2 type transport system ATP-binding protein